MTSTGTFSAACEAVTRSASSGRGFFNALCPIPRFRFTYLPSGYIVKSCSGVRLGCPNLPNKTRKKDTVELQGQKILFQHELLSLSTKMPLVLYASHRANHQGCRAARCIEVCEFGAGAGCGIRSAAVKTCYVALLHMLDSKLFDTTGLLRVLVQSFFYSEEFLACLIWSRLRSVQHHGPTPGSATPLPGARTGNILGVDRDTGL